MSAEPEIDRYPYLLKESDKSTQGSSKSTDKLIKTENLMYVGNYTENRTSIIFQVKDYNPKRHLKLLSDENDLRTTGGLEEKFKRYSTPRSTFNKSK
jgi:hypothetical protein